MLSHPIFIAAIFPTLFVLLLVVGTILWRSPREERPLIGLLLLLELPMWFFSTFVIRHPFNHWFDTVINPSSGVGLFLRLFQAPLVEEPCKLWLIFLVWHYSRLTKENALRVAMAVGASFGISEIWGLAYTFSLDPATFGKPWYHFIGFIQERMLVAPIHGVFVAAAARQIVKGGRAIVVGILSGMGLHYLANFPLLLSRLDVGHLGKGAWAVILLLYVSLYVVLMYALLLYFAFGEELHKKGMSGLARCPECQAIYKRPLVRINVGPFLSYERCASCQKSHWIRLKDMQEKTAVATAESAE